MFRLAAILAELLAGAIVISLFVSLFAVPAILLGARSLLGENNPQYSQFLSELERYRMILKGRALLEGDELDISTLNEGNWRTACLVGGYKDYARVINARESVDWKPKTSTFVDEFEMALVYVDVAGIPNVMHFRSGIGPIGQHFERCITKPDTRIQLFHS
ncbi:hypothetical protein LJR090_003584 [Bosea sp. LjRoot90]|uniref:hypothetical protein n=1 Tax=Bosea sp. LjRoot90 TaxID=3342342 RepID=UPI003ECCAE10